MAPRLPTFQCHKRMCRSILPRVRQSQRSGLVHWSLLACALSFPEHQRCSALRAVGRSSEVPTSLGTARKGQIWGVKCVTMASPIYTSLLGPSPPHRAWPYRKHPSSPSQPRAHGLGINAVNPGTGGLSSSTPTPLSSPSSPLAPLPTPRSGHFILWFLSWK